MQIGRFYVTPALDPVRARRTKRERMQRIRTALTKELRRRAAIAEARRRFDTRQSIFPYSYGEVMVTIDADLTKDRREITVPLDNRARSSSSRLEMRRFLHHL